MYIWGIQSYTNQCCAEFGHNHGITMEKVLRLLKYLWVNLLIWSENYVMQDKSFLAFSITGLRSHSVKARKFCPLRNKNQSNHPSAPHYIIHWAFYCWSGLQIMMMTCTKLAFKHSVYNWVINCQLADSSLNYKQVTWPSTNQILGNWN